MRLLLAALLALAAPAMPLAAAPAAAAPSAFERDRADILAMAGNFKVRFDMQESTAWDPSYTPLDRKISGGHEAVRVIEDSDRRIVLQHLLVVEHGGQTHVIKHWRQDWEYEPARILAYAGPGQWRWQDVPRAERTGRWAQTVWQVDDSPRYSGWGRWEEQNGLRRWVSNATWRPLARRDAVRKPVYDRYWSVNRHQSSPTGWVHWQDNVKLASGADGALRPIVQEYVLNSYERFDGFDVKAADDYWARTRDFWAAVRTRWDKVAERQGGIPIAEEAETGSVVSARLLGLADELAAGTASQAAAIAKADTLIGEATAGKLASR